MARRYRKRSKRKQEESLGELLATATAIITLFVTKGNLVATLIMMLIVGVGVPLIIKVYKQNKKKERYLTSGMADIDQMSGEEFEELLKYHFQEQGLITTHRELLYSPITISATVLNSLRKRQESSCMTAQSLRSL